MINRSVDILDARVIQWRISQCLKKRRKDGTHRFECIDAVWLIDEAHLLWVSPKDSTPIMVNIEGDGKETTFVSDYVEYLSVQWATWNGCTVLTPPAEMLLNQKRILSIIGDDKDPGRMRRGDLWRKSYKRRPYLRHLSKDQFVEYGRKVLAEMDQHFMKNGKKGTKEEIMAALERFTHLLDETDHRGIDMREFKTADCSELKVP